MCNIMIALLTGTQQNYATEITVNLIQPPPGSVNDSSRFNYTSAAANGDDDDDNELDMRFPLWREQRNST